MHDEYIVIHNQVADCSQVLKELEKLDKKENNKDKEYEEIYVSGVLAHCYFKGSYKECEDFYSKNKDKVPKCLIVISVEEAKEKYPEKL